MIEWFNYYGLIIMSLMMIPNIIFAITHNENQPQGYLQEVCVIVV